MLSLAKNDPDAASFLQGTFLIGKFWKRQKDNLPKKKNERYFHSVFILVSDKITVKCIKYNYRLHSLEGKLLSSEMTFSFYFKYLPEKDAEENDPRKISSGFKLL